MLIFRNIYRVVLYDLTSASGWRTAHSSMHLVGLRSKPSKPQNRSVSTIHVDSASVNIDLLPKEFCKWMVYRIPFHAFLSMLGSAKVYLYIDTAKQRGHRSCHGGVPILDSTQHEHTIICQHSIASGRLFYDAVSIYTSPNTTQRQKWGWRFMYSPPK